MQAGLIDIFNPFKYFTPEQYMGAWQSLFNTFLVGFWGRLFASSFLILAFWFGVVRQKVALAVLFFGMTVFFAYCGNLTKIIFWWVY